MKSEQLQKKNSNNIVILGSGYIATHLYNHLEENYNVEMKSSKYLDYHDKKTLWRYLSCESHPTYVINCSGFTGRPNIDEAETKKDLCWKLNVTSPLQVANLCERLGIKYIHIGSGCIYDGYEKEFTEKDVPNFGLWSNDSSFYSKCKHAFEVMTENIPVKHVRIRMPLSSLDNERSYLSKIKKYDNLIDYKNSKTYVPDLCGFIQALIEREDIDWDISEKFNVVNPEPLYTAVIGDMMLYYENGNPNWKYVSIDEIPIKTGRSNCVLDGSKVNKIYPMRTETEVLKEILQ